MTDPSTSDVSNESPDDNYSPATDSLAELRGLLLGAELQERLEKAKLRSEDVSRVLPEAIILRTIQDKQLAKALVPTVEEAIKTSVRKDFKILANALFPVIGPAIRKAIASRGS